MGYRINSSSPLGSVGSRGIIEDAKEALEHAEQMISNGSSNVIIVEVETGHKLDAEQIKARLATIRWNERNA